MTYFHLASSLSFNIDCPFQLSRMSPQLPSCSSQSLISENVAGLLSMLNSAAGSSSRGLMWISMLSTNQLLFEILGFINPTSLLFGRVGVQTNRHDKAKLLLIREG